MDSTMILMQAIVLGGLVAVALIGFAVIGIIGWWEDRIQRSKIFARGRGLCAHYLFDGTSIPDPYHTSLQNIQIFPNMKIFSDLQIYMITFV